MNRELLIKSIAEKSGRNAEEVDTALELVLQEIGSVLASGESVSLGGYGVFVPRYAKRYQKRHNYTTVWKAEGSSPGSKTVEFRPRKDFIRLLNPNSLAPQDSSSKH